MPQGATSCNTPFGLTTNPTDGPAPLLVSFELKGPITNTTMISWAFGDGRYLNGSGPDYSFAAQSYPLPGTYNASVTVDPAAPMAKCAVVVTVQPGPLLVSFIATVYSGTAPLTVDFTGVVSGGTGDYRSELWSFGDGRNATGLNASYTFRTAGSFRIVWTVSDSSGVQGAASRLIVVNDTPSLLPRPPGGSPTTDLEGWSVLAGGLAVAFAAVGFALFTRRRTPLGASSSGTLLAPYPPAGATYSLPPNLPPIRAELTGTPGPADPPPRHARGPATRPHASTAPNSLRTSQRVIAHLARQGTPPFAPIGTRGLTQVGISESLGLEQSNLARVLQRLEIAGVVTRDLRHVPGITRRVRVYLLTPTGQRIAAAMVQSEVGHHNGSGFPSGSEPGAR